MSYFSRPEISSSWFYSFFLLIKYRIFFFAKTVDIFGDHADCSAGGWQATERGPHPSRGGPQDVWMDARPGGTSQGIHRSVASVVTVSTRANHM